jgi:hypothetical protein
MRRSDVRSPGYIVAKVFLGCRTKILRTAEAFYPWRPEGPYRFIQNRPRTFLAALKSYRAAEKSKDQLLRDFWGCSIFDFCNNICHFQTHAPQQTASSIFSVPPCKQGRRHCRAERLRNHDKLKLCRCFHRQVGSLLALKDAIKVGGGAAIRPT